MADIQRARSEEKEIVTVSGDLTVPYAKALKSALLEAVQNAQAVVLAVEKVSNLDVSFPQLVCSAHRTAVALNKELTIIGLEQDPLAQVLRQAGFIRHTGCHESTRKSCLWQRCEEAN